VLQGKNTRISTLPKDIFMVQLTQIVSRILTFEAL
jgi:hypothetical protein